MGWRTGIREIPSETFNAILAAAKVEPRNSAAGRPAKALPLPPVSQIQVVDEPGELLIQRPRRASTTSRELSAGRSSHSKDAGDRAEELVYRWLRSTLPEVCRDSVDWIAQRLLVPGWDIEYTNSIGCRIAVEVKGTSMARFSAVELTANEWKAAQKERQNYVIALVASVFSSSPRISLLRDPYGRMEQGALEVEPTGWRLVNVSDRK